MQEGRDRPWRSHPDGDPHISDVRVFPDTVAMSMRSAGGSHWRGFHSSPPRKLHQNHHYQPPSHQQQQQQQVPAKTDSEEHAIKPKTSTTAATPSAGQNPNVRRANAIDRYSRVVFPVVFTAFSITYWAIYINASSSMVDLAGFVIGWVTTPRQPAQASVITWPWRDVMQCNINT